MMSDWKSFWDVKASDPSEFSAVGRSRTGPEGLRATLDDLNEILCFEPKDEVLDIGCGLAHIARAIASEVTSVVAVDFSSVMVRRAIELSAGVENLSFLVGSIDAVPVGDETFDKALAYSVLQYLPNITSVKLALRELWRVLRPGAIALMAATPDLGRKTFYESQLPSGGSGPSTGQLRQPKQLWFYPWNLAALAEMIGFHAELRSIERNVWHKDYMFDLRLKKPR